MSHVDLLPPQRSGGYQFDRNCVVEGKSSLQHAFFTFETSVGAISFSPKELDYRQSSRPKHCSLVPEIQMSPQVWRELRCWTDTSNQAQARICWRYNRFQSLQAAYTRSLTSMQSRVETSVRRMKLVGIG
jgi:hypothetical protein